MAKRRFIAWDPEDFCAICSKPAALKVATLGDPLLRRVCSEAHGQDLIVQLEREDEAEKAKT